MSNRFVEHGRGLLATLVEISVLDGEVVIELETMVETRDVLAGLEVVRSVMKYIGMVEQDAVNYSCAEVVVENR